MSISEYEIPEWLLNSANELLQILEVKRHSYQRERSLSPSSGRPLRTLARLKKGEFSSSQRKLKIKTDTLEALCIDE
jgi:hypothetical protein